MIRESNKKNISAIMETIQCRTIAPVTLPQSFVNDQSVYDPGMGECSEKMRRNEENINRKYIFFNESVDTKEYQDSSVMPYHGRQHCSYENYHHYLYRKNQPKKKNSLPQKRSTYHGPYHYREVEILDNTHANNAIASDEETKSTRSNETSPMEKLFEAYLNSRSFWNIEAELWENYALLNSNKKWYLSINEIFYGPYGAADAYLCISYKKKKNIFVVDFDMQCFIDPEYSLLALSEEMERLIQDKQKSFINRKITKEESIAQENSPIVMNVFTPRRLADPDDCTANNKYSLMNLRSI